MSPLPVVVAELHADAGGTIGDLIATFTAPDVTTTISTQTFLPNSSVTLDPHATYWFVLGSESPGDGTYLMEYANTNLSMGPGLLGNFADSSDSGTTWNYGDSSFPYFIQVNVAGTSFNPADLNLDGFVDGLDLGILLGNFNTSAAPNQGELNGTPPVDGLDLGILLGAWNPPTPAPITAVPEPTAAGLLLVGLLILTVGKR